LADALAFNEKAVAEAQIARQEKAKALAEVETVLQLAREGVATRKTADLKWGEDEESGQHDETELFHAGGLPVKFKVSWEGEMIVSVLSADSETELRMTIATTTGPANKRKWIGLANSVLSFDDVRVAIHEIEKQGSMCT